MNVALAGRGDADDSQQRLDESLVVELAGGRQVDARPVAPLVELGVFFERLEPLEDFLDPADVFLFGQQACGRDAGSCRALYRSGPAWAAARRQPTWLLRAELGQGQGRGTGAAERAHVERGAQHGHRSRPLPLGQGEGGDPAADHALIEQAGCLNEREMAFVERLRKLGETVPRAVQPRRAMLARGGCPRPLLIWRPSRYSASAASIMSNRMACMLWMLWAAASIDCRQWADFSGRFGLQQHRIGQHAAAQSLLPSNSRRLAEMSPRRRKPRIASTAGERIPAGEPRHRAVAERVARGSPISRSARAASSQAARSVLSRRKWRADRYARRSAGAMSRAFGARHTPRPQPPRGGRLPSRFCCRAKGRCIAPVENLGQIRVFPAETASRFPNELEIDALGFPSARPRIRCKWACCTLRMSASSGTTAVLPHPAQRTTASCVGPRPDCLDHLRRPGRQAWDRRPRRSSRVISQDRPPFRRTRAIRRARRLPTLCRQRRKVRRRGAGGQSAAFRLGGLQTLLHRRQASLPKRTMWLRSRSYPGWPLPPVRRRAAAERNR